MASLFTVLAFLALIWAVLSWYERTVENSTEHRGDGPAAPAA